MSYGIPSFVAYKSVRTSHEFPTTSPIIQTPQHRLNIMPLPVLFLTSFAESGLLNIYSAKTKEEFDAAFESFFYKDVEITVNDKKVTRDAYKAQLLKQITHKHVNDSTVNFAGAVEVDDQNSDLVSSSLLNYRDTHKILTQV